MPPLKYRQFSLEGRQAMTAAGNRKRTVTRVDWPRVLTDSCRAIERSDREPPLDALAAAAGVSASELQRQFTRRLGISPKAYARALRLQRLARDAAASKSTLDAVLAAGFGSSTTAYAVAGRALGTPPGRLRQPLLLHWWLGLTSLGWMLIAATNKGICWIAFGSAPSTMQRELRDAFPRAELRRDEQRLTTWFNRVRNLLLLPDEARDLPLDVQGTAFQSRVWNALRKIPLGSTASYTQIAGRIGRPRAVRAVANACRNNPVAVLIPCHRVIGVDGSLTGYRGGLRRKKALLEREGAGGWH